jgi:hypothetical protein
MGDNKNLYFEKIGYEDVKWTHLLQDSGQLLGFVKTVMSFGVPYKAGNVLKNKSTSQSPNKHNVAVGFFPSSY